METASLTSSRLTVETLRGGFFIPILPHSLTGLKLGVNFQRQFYLVTASFENNKENLPLSMDEPLLEFEISDAFLASRMRYKFFWRTLLFINKLQKTPSNWWHEHQSLFKALRMPIRSLLDQNSSYLCQRVARQCYSFSSSSRKLPHFSLTDLLDLSSWLMNFIFISSPADLLQQQETVKASMEGRNKPFDVLETASAMKATSIFDVMIDSASPFLASQPPPASELSLCSLEDHTEVEEVVTFSITSMHTEKESLAHSCASAKEELQRVVEAGYASIREQVLGALAAEAAGREGIDPCMGLMTGEESVTSSLGRVGIRQELAALVAAGYADLRKKAIAVAHTSEVSSLGDGSRTHSGDGFGDGSGDVAGLVAAGYSELRESALAIVEAGLAAAYKRENKGTKSSVNLDGSGNIPGSGVDVKRELTALVAEGYAKLREEAVLAAAEGACGPGAPGVDEESVEEEVAALVLAGYNRVREEALLLQQQRRGSDTGSLVSELTGEDAVEEEHSRAGDSQQEGGKGSKRMAAAGEPMGELVRVIEAGYAKLRDDAIQQAISGDTTAS